MLNLFSKYIKILFDLLRKEDIKKIKKLIGLSKNNCKNFISEFYKKLKNQFHKDMEIQM